MNLQLVFILNYSVGIGAIIGLVRVRKIDRAYYPFITLLTIGLLNEIVNNIVICLGYSNALNDNIYSLVESLLLVWIFKAWGTFGTSWQLPRLFIATFLVAWIGVNFFISSINKFSSYYNILYGLTVALLSIHTINRILVNDKGVLLKNAIFLACIGFVAFFTYKALLEIFWVYGLNATKAFRLNVYRIMTYVNFSVNILYAIAVLWIPKKREYTLL